jgi:hypothetical protein
MTWFKEELLMFSSDLCSKLFVVLLTIFLLEFSLQIISGFILLYLLRPLIKKL